MELREVVNAGRENSGSGAPDGIFQEQDDSLSAPGSPMSSIAAKSSSYGTCLYLGPAGERCNRPAHKTGFCAKHQLSPPGESESRAVTVKRAAAVIGVLAALWPFIVDLIRELIRLLR